MSTAHPAASFVPAGAWDNRGSRAHSVQFYGDDLFLLEELSRFIGSALGAGDVGIVIATKMHRDGLAERLKARGLDLAHVIAQGRCIWLDAAQTLSHIMPGSAPDAARFTDLMSDLIARATRAAADEHPRVAIFGEMVALLWAEGKTEAALRLEQLWNDLARTHAFALYCAYPLRYFGQAGDGEALGKICAVHGHVIPAESYSALSTAEERMRAITHLQQKAQALETEIEERRKVEQALRERNQELRDAVATRDEFLSIAAHELRTPVTSLRGFAQLLLRDARRQRGIAPERLEYALAAIESQSEKLRQLVARLLDTAQIDAGKLRIQPVRADLVALIRAALAQQHTGDGHMLVFAGPERLDALVDPLRFEQVITNLLDNAIKFSPEGGTITVELGQSDDGGIQLSVTDQGVGITPDQREAIFDHFHQAHGERQLTGMGLGLYLTREIVELHGGRVRAEEPEHRGSRFVVSLPPCATDTQAGSAA
ncbi:MAG TPA: ATP-binding protein [Chloroflexota bacterium]|nr:ATP-binding protein [Chloroflexota bacterium]